MTIPEGATLDTIATLVEQAYGGSISADQFKDAASSTEPMLMIILLKLNLLVR